MDFDICNHWVNINYIFLEYCKSSNLFYLMNFNFTIQLIANLDAKYERCILSF
jgi:hypothetical protein